MVGLIWSTLDVVGAALFEGVAYGLVPLGLVAVLSLLMATPFLETSGLSS